MDNMHKFDLNLLLTLEDNLLYLPLLAGLTVALNRAASIDNKVLRSPAIHIPKFRSGQLGRERPQTVTT